MLELLKKNDWTEEEIKSLDSYYDKHIEETIELESSLVVNLIKKSNEVLGYSLLEITLDQYLLDLAIDSTYLFEEDKLDEYDKCLELIQVLKYPYYQLAFSLADYYWDKDRVKALEYYEVTFVPGFDLGQYNYYDHLVKYLNSLNKNPSEFLIELIDNWNDDGKYDLDIVKTFLLLIINLDKNEQIYLDYINKAIPYASGIVAEYRKRNEGVFNPYSDTEEEQFLCELLALKLEYYVIKKEYVFALEMYNELTDEIGRSDCTKYYQARDLFYYNMLDDLSKEYPELEFFETKMRDKYFIVEEINELDDINNFLDKEITLKDNKGRTFKFVIDYIYKDNWDDYHIRLVAILPLLGMGAKHFLELKKEKDKIFLYWI